MFLIQQRFEQDVALMGLVFTAQVRLLRSAAHGREQCWNWRAGMPQLNRGGLNGEKHYSFCCACSRDQM